MALTEKISEDLKLAMKAGDKTRIDTLRMVRAQILEFEKKGGSKDMTPDDELQLLSTAVKKRKESIEQYEKAGRTDLVDKEAAEVAIITEYLPKQMDKADAEKIIFAIMEQAGPLTSREMGKVMPAIMKELKGKIDGKTINEIVKTKLT
jgi:hypothetical protein